MMMLSDSAQKQLHQQLLQQHAAIGVRVGVKNAGCNGFAYTMDFAKAITDQDEVAVIDGIPIIINKSHLNFLEGTTLDYVAEGLNSTFKFMNPKVKSECGCGESFSIEK